MNQYANLIHRNINFMDAVGQDSAYSFLPAITICTRVPGHDKACELPTCHFHMFHARHINDANVDQVPLEAC